MNGRAKWIVTGWLMVALSPLPAGAALNNQPAPPVDSRLAPLTDQTRPMEQAGEFSPRLEKANELIGAKVLNDKGERLGTIEDIVLTPDRTGVSYAVLSHGGFLGWGGKLFAVPWSAFEIRTRDKVLILSNVSVDDLKNAKGFDKNNWPTMADKNWLGRDVSGEAGPAAVGTPRVEHEPMAAKADMKYRKLSALVGMTIKNNQGDELGELEDIVIDTHEGKIAYAVLSMRSGFLKLNKELAAVPWSSFEIIPELGTARLNADKETLQAIAFDEKDFPNLADREYSRKIHERFGATPYWETYGYVPGEGGARPEGSLGKEGGRYGPEYNAGEVKTIHGTIVSVGTFRPEGTTVEGLRLRVKTDDGKTVTVHAGPREYVERQNIGFHYGDEVTITGSTGKMGWRDVIVASQIKKGDKTLDLRTEEGKPRSNADSLEGSRSGD